MTNPAQAREADMKKLKIDELTRLAFIWAEQDRAAMADAWPRGSPERAESQNQRDQLHNYRVKKWGRTVLETVMSNAKAQTIR